MARGPKGQAAAAAAAPAPTPAPALAPGVPKKRGRPPGSGAKKAAAPEEQQQQHDGGAAQPAAATPGGRGSPKVRRVAHTTAQAVAQMASHALGLLFQPKALAAGLEGFEALPAVREAAAAVNAFVRAPAAADGGRGRRRRRRRRGAGGAGGGAAPPKSFRAGSIITSLAYGQVMAARLVDMDKVNGRLVMLAVGKAWRQFVASAKPDKLKAYNDVAEELCAALKERQAKGEVFPAQVPYAAELEALMAARGRPVPDFTKHIKARLPAAVAEVVEADAKAAASRDSSKAAAVGGADAGAGGGAAAPKAPKDKAAAAAVAAAAPRDEKQHKKHKHHDKEGAGKDKEKKHKKHRSE